MILSIDDKNVICGVHTMTITSSKKAIGVASESQMFRYSGFDEKNGLYSYIVNIEKLDVGANKSIITFTDFLKRLSSNFCLSDVSIKRIDFRIDFLDVKYEDYYKPFLLICIMLSKLNAKSNTFMSSDTATFIKKTIRVNDSRFEFEYYNKLVQNPVLGIPARVEFRLKGVSYVICDTVMLVLIKKILLRLSRCINRTKYEKTIEYLNKCIVLNLNEEKLDWWTPNQRSEFVRRNSIRIFLRRQIIEVCKELGYKNPIR